MSDMTYFPIASDFKVRIEDVSREPLPHFVVERIEAIWNMEKEQLGSVLFNGSLMSVVRFDEHELVGRIVEYKHYMAQMRDPALKSYLDLLPLGVSARTISGNSILIGRRSQKVFLDRGKLECVPSGGVDLHARNGDYLDMRRQIEIELHEETGLPSSHIQNYAMLGIVKADNICEICVELTLDDGLEKTDLMINDEYSQFFWVEKNQIAKFLEERSAEIIPVSRWLLSGK